MRLSTRSLTILYLDSMTSEFEKKEFIYMYLKLRPGLQDGYEEKGIHWIPKLRNLCYIE